MTARREAPQELELKYAVADPSLVRDRLDELRVDGLELGDWRVRDVEDRYVDTASLALRRAGYGARIRIVDGQRTLTVKTLEGVRRGKKRGTPALHQRDEYEAPAGRGLDPGAWPPSEARSLVERITGGGRLRTRFVIRQRRHERDVVADGGRAVLSLDDVEVRRGGETLQRFSALEVESSDGSDELLGRVSEEIERLALAVPEARSKERIATELLERSGADPAAALLGVSGRPGVRPQDSLATAGRKILRVHLASMLARESGVRSDGIEDVHKMRVATRRMRSMWRIFGEAYPAKLRRRYVAELRDVARALGDVRDLDVLLLSLDVHASGERRAALQPLEDEWRRRRQAAHEQLVRLLDSARYARFIDDYVDFVSHEDDGGHDPADRSAVRVRDAAAGRIWQAFERVRAFEPVIGWGGPEELHALRIESKRLRYTLESFREVLPDDAAEIIERVTAAQDHLGALNDAHVAAGLVRDWLGSQAGVLDDVTGREVTRYLVAREREAARLRRGAPAAWRRITGPAIRRRMALSLAAL